MQILVAGGGLAGLTAALALTRGGATVTLLDARDRLGGRVWTARDGFPAGQHGELGGEFIDRGQDAIWTLCDRLAVPRVRVLRGGFSHRILGDDGEYHISRTRPWTELERILAPLLQRYRRAGGDSASDDVREIAALSVREWLRRQRAPPALHSMADALRGFFLADPDDLSVLPLIEQIVSGGSPAQVEMYRVEGGADRLVDALARAGGARLLLRHHLTAVAQATDRIVATVVDEGGHQQQLEADAAVIALPASTLADVAIAPSLPDDQWRAIRTLRYGCATKVVLHSTSDPFRGRRARAFATDTPIGAVWYSSNGALTFLAGGSASRGLKARAERGSHAILADLCWLGVRSDSVPNGVVYAATWEDDRWARGGYAYLDPGFDPALRAQLSRRAGRLVFAGEHTSSRWQGYMNGAVESGVRAAGEILDL